MAWAYESFVVGIRRLVGDQDHEYLNTPLYLLPLVFQFF